MRQLILLAFIIIGSSFYLSSPYQDIPSRKLKKIDKELAKLWEGVSIKKVYIEIDGNKIEEYKGYEQLFELKNETNKLLAYMMLSKAPGRYDDFDLMVIYDTTDLKIKSTSVLIYREEYGGEIGSRRWLKQFIGKNFSNTFRLDYEIQGISGATISVRSATKEIKQLSLLMKSLKDEKVLPTLGI